MIVIVGFMGAGKSTIGPLLAKELGLPFVDADLAIEQRAGRSIGEIFASHGERAFRALEHRVIADLLDGPDVVLALGGGAPEHAGTRRKLVQSSVVYLQVGYRAALRRVSGDAARPLLAQPDLPARYQRRLPVYSSVATVAVRTEGRDPDTVAKDILARLT